LEFRPLPGQVLFGMSFEVLSAIVDRMLGGMGESNNVNRELTDIEESLATKIIERTIKILEKTWSKILSVNGHIIGLDKDYTTIQIVSSSEIVALITFEIQISGKYFGLMSFCFTYPFLENILPLLTTQHIYQKRGLVASVEEQQQMVEKLDTSNIDINVLLGHTDITTKDFLELKEGDVIKLNEKTTDPMIVMVNGERKFFGHPGRIKDKVCVKISDVYDDKINILKDYE